MKKLDILNYDCQSLEDRELVILNGGATPDSGTSFANNLAYYVSYGFFAFCDGVRAFGAGASKGQQYRFSG